MGLGNESQGGGNWLTIIKGEIVRRVPPGTTNAVERTTKGGKLVHELRYNTLEGTLKRIDVSSGEYGDQWVFVIDDGKQEYFLALPYSSGTANGFLFRLPNINFEAPLKINTYYIQDKDDPNKWRQALTLSQGGVKLERYFTKEEPHRLPDMEKVLVRGQEEWDNSKRLDFLRKMVDEKVNPKLKDLYPIDNVGKEEEVPAPVDESDDIDDLPF